MGGCFGGERMGLESAQLLQQLTPKSRSGLLLLPTQLDPPLTLRVAFHGENADAEANVVKALTSLLWIEESPRDKTEIAICMAAMCWAQGQMLLDFTVPVLNVALHAENPRVRETLWDCFALPAVRENLAVAHLFYWALRCVLTSPQAKAEVKEAAQAKVEEVEEILSSRAQVTSARFAIQEANMALKGGQQLQPVKGLTATGVTPLIEMLDRLHNVGEQIVKVRNKQERQIFLSKQLQEQVNDDMVGAAPVPVMMLSPAGTSAPSPASLLHLPTAEARVLSSKERAPYLVVLEVEKEPEKLREEEEEKPSPAPGRLFGLCPSRSSPALLAPEKQRLNGAASSLQMSSSPITGTGPSLPSTALGGGRSLSSSARSLPSTSATWFADENSPDNADGEVDDAQEAVAKYLRDQDLRPKGAFQRETWEQVVQRVRAASDFGKRPSWDLLSLIVKSNADDVRQEELAFRLLKWFKRVFRRHGLKLWFHPFLIVATRHDGGVLETVTNAISLSELKKSYGNRWHSLRSYFEQTFPRVESTSPSNGRKAISLDKAVTNFIWSMASYSVVCYVLAIRDRHNGNILIDDEGHILHVDFGFMLCGAPGGKAMQKMGGFELSDGFKLTREFAEVLGPEPDKPFLLFKDAVLDGIFAVRRQADELLALLQLSMLGAENHEMGCFNHPDGKPEYILTDVCERLGLRSKAGKPAMSDEEFRAAMDTKILQSVDHWRSRLYDKYQYHFTGVH